MSYSMAIEHHRDSDVGETTQPRESKLRWSMWAKGHSSCNHSSSLLFCLGYVGLVHSPILSNGVE